MIIIYRILLILVSPIIFIYLLYRYIIGKEEKGRFQEKFSLSKIRRPSGKLIWFNAVSVGEINSVWSIIKKINKDSNYNILITTTTVTGSHNVLDKVKTLDKPEKIIHQYAPIDLIIVIQHFLKHWQPNLLVNIESEFWPNLFTMTSKKCPILVLNGKMSKRSFRFWNRFKNLKELIFTKIDLCLAQSKSDYKRFINLGVQNVQFIGNTKFFVDKCKIDEELYKKLLQETKNRQVWLVNCTHKGEEEFVLETHKKLKEKYPNTLTFLIIRHPKRIHQVEKILEDNKIEYTTTTKNNRIEDNTEFYIHDELGNLGTFFELCKIVFLGGSLVKGIGGHSPSEAIKHSCCVVTGSYIDNNKNIFGELVKNYGCIILEDNKSEPLYKTISYLFDNPIKVNNISINAYRKSLEYSNIVNEVYDLIIKKINKK